MGGRGRPWEGGGAPMGEGEGGPCEGGGAHRKVFWGLLGSFGSLGVFGSLWRSLEVFGGLLVSLGSLGVFVGLWEARRLSSRAKSL
jgi:hypothetical protein